MLQVNEAVLDRVLNIYKIRLGGENIPWNTVVTWARAEIACLVEDDVEHILNQDELPELRASWNNGGGRSVAQSHLELMQRFIRKYCQVRQDRIRDSKV